jgi:hypothetical protein
VNGTIQRLLPVNNKWERLNIQDLEKDVTFIRELELKYGKRVGAYERSEQIVGVEYHYEMNNRVYIKHQYFHGLTKERMLMIIRNGVMEINVNRVFNSIAFISL